MKEFIFYLSPSETREFANRLLSRNCTLIPKVPFPNGSSYPRFSSTLPQEPLEKIFPNLSVLVFGPFSSEGPVVRVLPSGKLARVSDNQGGPMIALHLPGLWSTRNGVGELSPGMLTLQNVFWDSALSKKIGPTPDVKRYYSDLVNELKIELSHINGLWIGKEAMEWIGASKIVLRPHLVKVEGQ